jgi:hypothetical protein
MDRVHSGLQDGDLLMVQRKDNGSGWSIRKQMLDYIISYNVDVLQISNRNRLCCCFFGVFLAV